MSYLCRICANSNVLCAACLEKLKSGKISDFDIDMAKFLQSLKIKNVKILKVINGGNILIIVEKGHAADIIGKKGSTAKAISEHYKKPVRIIEASDIKIFLESLLGAAFASLNNVYTKDGDAYKIRLKKRTMKEKDIKTLVESLYGKKAEIAYE